MKRIIATTLASAALLGVVAIPAQAGPVDSTMCAVYDKIGVEHVRECGTGNPDS